MISLALEMLAVTSGELREIAAAMATSLERAEGWPAAKVQCRAEESPEDDPDRSPGTWYFVNVEGLPHGVTLHAETKGLPHRRMSLRAENEKDVDPILAALREAFAAQAGPLSWIEPAAFPEEWSRLQRESAAVLGAPHWLPASTFALTESFAGLRYAYAFPDPETDPIARSAQLPGWKDARQALLVGPVPRGETASSLVVKAGRVPPVDEIVAAFLGADGGAPRAELIASGSGPAFPYTLALPGGTVRMETWATGPWRVRIGRSDGVETRFQIAVQHLQGGDRALFASSEMEVWKKTSTAVTAGACAPTPNEAVAMVRRLLARIEG